MIFQPIVVRQRSSDCITSVESGKSSLLAELIQAVGIVPDSGGDTGDGTQEVIIQDETGSIGQGDVITTTKGMYISSGRYGEANSGYTMGQGDVKVSSGIEKTY